MDAREKFAAGRLMCAKRAPYFSAVIHGLAPVSSPGLGTLGVTKSGVLMIDWDFIDRCSPEQVAGALVHESLHMCLNHHKRTEMTGHDPERANIAHDLAINPSVRQMGFVLPQFDDFEPCFPETDSFPIEDGFVSGLTSEEYYDLLRKNDSEGGGGKDNGLGRGRGKPRVGNGHCGSCSGHALPNEPTDEHEASRSQNEIDRMIRETAEAVHQAAMNGQGNIPSNLKRWASEHLKPAVVPWQRKLGYALRAGCAWTMGHVAHRYNGVSRRQAGLGFGAGCPVLPRLEAPVPNVAVIIDTSGSMGSDELGRAASEVDGILRATRASVTIVTCDAAVAGIKQVDNVKKAVAMLAGGGGTDMRPAIDATMKLRCRPDVIVCVTDGCIPDPGPAPRGAKFIWIVVGPYQRTDALKWGEVVQIPHGGSA